MNYDQYISTKNTLCFTWDRLSKARCTDDYCLKDNHPSIKHLQKKIVSLEQKIKEYEDTQIKKSML